MREGALKPPRGCEVGAKQRDPLNYVLLIIGRTPRRMPGSPVGLRSSKYNKSQHVVRVSKGILRMIAITEAVCPFTASSVKHLTSCGRQVKKTNKKLQPVKRHFEVVDTITFSSKRAPVVSREHRISSIAGRF